MAGGVMAWAVTPLKTSKLFSLAEAFEENAKTTAINIAKARIEGWPQNLNEFKNFMGNPYKP